MLDRVARLPGAPCLLARGTRLGGVAFCQVNGSSRAISANRGEINRENMAARSEYFRSYHLQESCHLPGRGGGGTGGKSPFSLLSEPISLSSLLFSLFLPPPYFFPYFSLLPTLFGPFLPPPYSVPPPSCQCYLPNRMTVNLKRSMQ